MTSKITYPFSDPSKYEYDQNKIIFQDGKASLKLVNNIEQEFIQSFSSSSGFLYDSSKTEFDSGSMKQKDLTEGATAGATFTEDEDLNWGDGTFDGTLESGTTVSDGKLNCLGDADKSCSWSAEDNAPIIQTGSIFIKYTPGYSGAPSTTKAIFGLGPSNSNLNAIHLLHTNTGYFRLVVWDNAGSTIVNEALSTIFNPVEGQEYNFQINIDVTTGETELYVDGVQYGVTATETGTRSAPSGDFVLGNNHRKIYDESDAEYSAFKIFDSVQTVSSSFSVAETKYGGDKVILPNFIYSEIGDIQTLDAFSITGTGNIHFTINSKYWNGVVWTNSNNSFAQSNTASEVNDHISSLPPSDTLVVRVVFADTLNGASIDNLTLEYTGQIYSTGGQTIEMSDGFRIEDLISFVENITATGSDTVKYSLKKDNNWYYHNGSSWAIANGSYSQSNTAAEITTNISSFTSSDIDFKIKVFLYSNDGSTTPEIDSLELTFDFVGGVQDEVYICSVYCYVKKLNGEIPAEEITAKLSTNNIRYKNNILIAESELTKTPRVADGYIEFDLVENINMKDSNGNSVHYVIKQGEEILAKVRVPEQPGALIWDILA